jgi:hypothetical protein
VEATLQAQRDAQRQRENQLLLATALDIPQRDRAIRKLHNYLGLGSKHRQNLCARGLTDAQIDAGYFFTIYPTKNYHRVSLQPSRGQSGETGD